VKLFLRYSAYLIGTYLVVYNATGAGKLVQQGGSSGATLVKAFQGR
jgi:hypothetical protein